MDNRNKRVGNPTAAGNFAPVEQDHILHIPLPATFSFSECLWFLDRAYDDCMHRIEGNCVIKAVLIGTNPLLLSISAGDGYLQVTILQGNTDEDVRQQVKEYVTAWLDIDHDLTGFYKLLKSRKKLAYMVNAFHGLRLIAIPDLFEAICWSVIGQQINLSFAYKLKRRLVERYGMALHHEGRNYYLFPRPDVLAHVTTEELRAMQFSTPKATYLTAVSGAFAAGVVSREQLLSLPDVTAQQQLLTGIKGVGIWTANYTLMKSLKVRSCIPYGDAGLLNALMAHGIIGDKKTLAPMHRLFRYFAGWESYLVFYLWRSLAKKGSSGT